MYITITAQSLSGNYAQSAAAFVDYLEKENEGKPMPEMEHFFNQEYNEISAEEVVKAIDGNTAKLKKSEPKFYSITLNPSQRVLKAIQDSPEALKQYTREAMKAYAIAFNREIDGKTVSIDDIKYYAKVERQRTFKGTDKEIRENQPYATKILELRQQIRSIQREETTGNIKKVGKRHCTSGTQSPTSIEWETYCQGYA